MSQDCIEPSQKILYGEQTKLTINNMSFSDTPLQRFPGYIRSLAQVKQACAQANYRAGHLPQAKLSAIVAACEQLVSGKYLEQFPVDVYHGGGGIGINMNVNEVLASLAGENIQAIDDINASQSTSDVCHTALRITLISLVDKLEAAVSAVIATLQDKAEQYGEIETIARTCWQDGMSVSAGAVFTGIVAALKRQCGQLAELRQIMHQVNLGWTVIGSGTGADVGYRTYILAELANVTGEMFTWRSNSYDAAQYPDDLARLSATVKIIAGIVNKFSHDLRLLSSGPETGLSELKIPAVQAGSSFFPGKVNPVIPEMMIQCAMLISGKDTVIQNALDMGEIHLNLWEEMMGFLLMENMMMLTKALTSFDKYCLTGITVNRDVCEQYANSSIPLVVKYKEKYGYKKVCQIIKEVGVAGFIAQCKIDSTSK